MFVSFSKTLKKMGNFRLGFGMRINKKNAIFVCFAMLFVWTFQLMWYMIVGAGWLLYFMLYALYKIYYFLFKYCWIGIKKLFGAIVHKKDDPATGEAPAAIEEAVSVSEVSVEAERAPAPEDEEEAADPPVVSVSGGWQSPDNSPYEFIKTKIAGVAFKDGRKSRQTILRRLYWKDEPFDKNAAEVILERGEYEGKPAFAVMLNGEKAGYVPAEHAQFIEDNFDRCDGVTHIDAYHGKDDIYGAEIIIRFRKN